MPINNYKILREELDDLLISMEVPKHYFFALAELNRFLSIHRNSWKEYNRAMEVIHEISPIPLTHFEKGNIYDSSTDNSQALSSEVE